MKDKIIEDVLKDIKKILNKYPYVNNRNRGNNYRECYQLVLRIENRLEEIKEIEGRYTKRWSQLKGALNQIICPKPTGVIEIIKEIEKGN